jgi:hypothetical protein
MQALENFSGGHGDDNTGAVVDSAATEVPGIEVAGNDDDLLGMVATLEIGDDVVASDVGKSLGSEGEGHADATLGGEVLDQVGIFSGQSGGGDSSGDAIASMREAVVGASDGTN